MAVISGLLLFGTLKQTHGAVHKSRPLLDALRRVLSNETRRAFFVAALMCSIKSRLIQESYIQLERHLCSLSFLR